MPWSIAYGQEKALTFVNETDQEGEEKLFTCGHLLANAAQRFGG